MRTPDNPTRTSRPAERVFSAEKTAHVQRQDEARNQRRPSKPLLRPRRWRRDALLPPPRAPDAQNAASGPTFSLTEINVCAILWPYHDTRIPFHRPPLGSERLRWERRYGSADVPQFGPSCA